MAIPNGNVWQRKTIAATGTGSYYFTDIATPYLAIQVIPILPATGIELTNVFYSNVSPRDWDPGMPGDPNTPVTSSQHAYVWAGPDPAFSGTVVPPSAFLTSSLYNLGNIAAAHVRVDVGSKAGGEVIVQVNRKG